MKRKSQKLNIAVLSLVLFILNAYFYDAGWKPAIKYFDFFAQSTKENKVKQVFPFVKVSLPLFDSQLISQCALLRLHDMGAMSDFKKRIIVSDGGPGHFKVYKTQYWMSVWNADLRGITFEWNMYFANLGHNLCDGHAGKLKVYAYLIHCVVILHYSLILFFLVAF